jgi:hypothetical protein
MQLDRDFKGVWIPKDLYLDKSLSWTEKILLVEINSLDKNIDLGCYASNEYLAEFIGKSTGTTANLISGLIKRGYLFQVFFDGRSRGLRVKNIKENESRLHENVKQTSRKRESSVHENVNEPSRKREHSNIYSNTDSNTDSNIMSDGDLSIFEKWWELYGKKQDKKDCYKKWTKLTGDIKQRIIAHTEMYVKATPEIQYRKNPLTYLNKESWNNDIVINTANTEKELGATASFHTTDYTQKL